MPEVTNKKRAQWAEVAVVAFEKEVLGDRENNLCDLLCNLMHWADENRFDFSDELGRARFLYAEEVRDERGVDDATSK